MFSDVVNFLLYPRSWIHLQTHTPPYTPEPLSLHDSQHNSQVFLRRRQEEACHSGRRSSSVSFLALWLLAMSHRWPSRAAVWLPACWFVRSSLASSFPHLRKLQIKWITTLFPRSLYQQLMVSDCIHNTLLISIENKLVEHAFSLNCFSSARI